MKYTGLLIALVIAIGCSHTGSPGSTESRTLDPIEQRLRAVENALIPLSPKGEIEEGPPRSLAERMEHYGVPGVGIAVIEGYEIEWAKGYGVMEAGAERPIVVDTLFNAGSILKPVMAAAALNLVERGALDLDEDLNRQLLSWKIPENEHTVEHKVTLRRLLSHSAGLSDGFSGRSATDVEPDYVTPAGVAPARTIPMLLDAAPGVDVDGPTRVTAVPGTRFLCANADYAILSLLLEDVTGKPLSDVMRQTVLAPLEMRSSTFEQPLPENLRARATTEHDPKGRPFPGKRSHYPIGGLWSTPSDLARFAIELMRAVNGESDTILSQGMAREMIAPQIETPEARIGDSFGLGFRRDGSGPELAILHTGGTWGSTCILWAYPDSGRGVVIMTNSASAQGIIRFEILLGIAAV